MSNKNLNNNLFFETLICQQVILEAKQIGKDFENVLYNNLVKITEGKCKYEGYINPKSVKIIERSIGRLLPNKFRGDMVFDIKYKADVCNPVKGDVLNCTVIKKNNMGIMAKNGPLLIILPNDIHTNKKLIESIQINDVISISVIGKKYDINNDHIDVVARLAEDIPKKNLSNTVTKIVKTKTISEQKNTNNNNNEQNGGEYSSDMDDFAIPDEDDEFEDIDKENAVHEDDEEEDDEEDDDEDDEDDEDEDDEDDEEEDDEDSDDIDKEDDEKIEEEKDDITVTDEIEHVSEIEEMDNIVEEDD